ncbi:hypothetical protein ACERK3_07635 [Phycisphaerales bacterium AB-hyl4]|uniref:Uncharacterized protein n=1 Tax=Natronomicrosphaera hydrolytica TaxID=3242702 RepID=A0ABV4U4S3_9BACT
MNRERLIQLLSLTVTVVCLAGAVLLMPTINSQRRDLQLSFDIEVGDRVDARYAVTAAALGSFRGLAVDILWYRAEQLKNEGKFWEAATLAEWITTLQPRFPQVWSFHAWNMAYNISVQTHTPEERWNWVNKGIRLLREEGIPNNPTAIRLYRELGWIFFHKMGQYADDMHWYYKLKLAEEWQEVLGTPTQGADGEQAARNFAPVAYSADRYFQLDRPSLAMREQLRALAEQFPSYADELRDFTRRGLVRFSERAPSLAETMRSNGDRRAAEQLEALVETAGRRMQRATRDPLNLLYDDVPSTRPVVEQLRAIGMDADERTLRRVGRLEMYLMYVPAQTLMEHGGELLGLDEQELQLVGVLMNAEHREGVQALLAYLRARALVRHYHMDPVFMLQLMEDFGPIDWRHPASHGVYWSAMGVDRIRDVRDRSNIDMLNTNRQVIHGLQALMRTGRVSFDPLAGQVDIMPEPAFIPAYEQAMFDAEERSQELGLGSTGTIEHFEAGHENFLLTAIVYSYLYGEADQARYYYDRVRNLYGDNPHNVRSGRYQQTLDDLVVQMLSEDGGQLHQARQFVDSMIINGLTRGLAQGRMDVFNRFLTVARGGYDRYRAERTYANPNAPGPRMGMGLASTFRETFNNTYTNFMQSPRTSLIERSRIYMNTPTALQRETFPYFRNEVYQQAEQAGFDAERAFPPPPEVDDRQLRREREALPDTVERQ